MVQRKQKRARPPAMLRVWRRTRRVCRRRWRGVLRGAQRMALRDQPAPARRPETSSLSVRLCEGAG